MWRYYARRPAGGIVAAVMALACSVPARAADDASPWASSRNASARLVAGGFENGVHSAGVEIRLEGKSHTYWRSPGDAGVPPVFSWTGSDNLASAEVIYPAPRRLSEGGSDINGYVGDLILPLRVTPRDGTRPVDLALHLQYAACDKICIPAEARLRLRLAPVATSTPHAARIAAFAARAPVSADAPGAPALKLAPVNGAKPKWRVTLDPPVPVGADLFAEAPDGWFLETRRDGEGFLMVLAEQPSGAAAAPVDATLTYVTQAGAWEKRMRLDVAGAKP